MTQTFKKKTLTHLTVSSLSNFCPTLGKLMGRVNVTPHTALELRNSGFHIKSSVEDDELMLSLFDVRKLSKHWPPLRSATGLDFTPDAWYFLRPSHQFNFQAIEIQDRVEEDTHYLNFIDTLKDPVLDTIMQIRDINDDEETVFEDEYHEQTYLKVPVISEGVAYFFITSDFFKHKTVEGVGYCKYSLEHLFEEMEALKSTQHLGVKLILVSNYRKHELLSKEEAFEKLDKELEKINSKAARARKRAQKKYALEQEQADFPW